MWQENLFSCRAALLLDPKKSLHVSFLTMKRKNSEHKKSPMAEETGPSKIEEAKGGNEEDLENDVRVIRRLESEGHLETSFREKFLTWYNLRAAPREVRIVKVFIDTLGDDPKALADQLVDSFSDMISIKRCCTVPAGFCNKLWH